MIPCSNILSLLSAVVLLLASSAVQAQEPTDSFDSGTRMTPSQVFDFADLARDREDYTTAQTAYEALSQNTDIEIRTEARFRLAMMQAYQLDRLREAATLLRQILDEKPDAARVRVELARIQARMGHLNDAQRELRAAQATGLPAEVEQLVRFYASALKSRQPFGGSVQVAIAPDSNINRATRSEALETVIGEFELSDDAQATSGIGLSVKGQGYALVPLGTLVDLLVRANTSARIYQHDEFNDLIVSLQAGPQWTSGSDRLSLSAVASRRWYGGRLYNDAYGASLEWRHPLSKTTLFVLGANAIVSDDRLNDLRDAERYSLSLGLDHSISSRLGAGIRFSGAREAAIDPGYSTVSGSADAYLYREFGKTTLVLDGGYGRLEADKRLLLYPDRRVDERIKIGLSGTFRSLRVGSFAPILTVRFEDNRSSVEIYEYQRITAEIGITAAF